MAASNTTAAAEDVAVLGETPLGGGYMGPQAPTGYRLRITAGNGDRMTFDDLTSLSANRRHTAMSDWTATVPYRGGIDDRVLSSIRLSWGDTVLFRGRLEDVGGDIGEPVVELSGRGIEADLTRGDLRVDLRGARRWEAIRTVWRRHTSFAPTVLSPEGDGAANHPANGRVGERKEGTPMEILQDLHADAAMRFTVLHSVPGPRVESYPIGRRRRRHDWDVLGGTRDVSAKDYANRVVVRGAFKPDGSGERFVGIAENETEIEAMRQRGIGDDGRVTYPVIDDSITHDDNLGDPDQPDAQTGDENALEEAMSLLTDLVDKDSVGGSLDVTPTVANPGYLYYVPEISGPEPEPYGSGVYGEAGYGTTPGQYVSLNKIEYSITHGDESCSLDFSRREGFADTLARAYGGSR